MHTFFSKSLLFSFLVQARTKKNRLISGLANIPLIYFYQSDISRNAKIDETIFFPHPSGIIVGANTRIHGDIVVFDRTSFGKKYPGTKDGMPRLDGKGIIGSGAKILGAIKLEGKFVVAANAVVTQNLKNQTYTASSLQSGVYFEN